jgi:hypothetical protein
MPHVVTAFCPRSNCIVKEFTMLRETLEYPNAYGDITPIQHVRCPRCKAMSPIFKREEIA